VLEQNHVAGPVHASRYPRRLEGDERRQRMCRGRGCRRGAGDEAGEPQCLPTQIEPHEIVAGMGVVAFVEQQVDDLEHRLEARLELGAARQFEAGARLTQLPLRTYEALRNGRLRCEQRAGDLRDAEAADGLQTEGDPRVAGQRRMAAEKDHPQLVVAEGPVDGERAGVERVGRAGDLGRDLRDAPAERHVAAQGIERAVPGDAQEPRRGIVGNARERPLLQRLDERVLHDLFGELEVGRAEDAREPCDHLSRPVAEQMVHELMRRVRH
jgi:hypothetical protein